ncbi:MAG: M48 family metallopeptidase [bacterium]
MKKLVLPAILLLVMFIFASFTLTIPDSLPEGTIVPDEVKAIVSADRLDDTIIYSNFGYGWYFFNTVLGFIILGSILMLGVSPKLRGKAQSWAEKVTSFERAPLVCGGIAAFAAMLFMFLSATPEQPVSAGGLGLALAWGVVGLFVGKSSRFALTTFYVLLFFVLLDVINFPFAYYKGFVVEHHFELSKETFGKWFADMLKGNVIGYLFSILLIPLAYWGIRKSPKFWWAWIAAGSVPVIILMLVISPVYLDPLFNKYEPLKDEALRTKILAMAEESGISDSRVFQVDKSKETEKINAYVTGMFGTKRIVMWDTILNKLESDEVAFVMGHEMGHYVLNHIWKFIGIFTVTLFVLLFIVSRTIGFMLRRFGDRMGFNDISDIASLPLLLLMFGLLMFLITPALNAFSRVMEHDADRFGLELTHDGATGASAFVKLANENLSNPAPHPFIEFWLYNHPTLKDRIDFCKQYAPAEETDKMEETEKMEQPEETQEAEPVQEEEMTIKN